MILVAGVLHRPEILPEVVHLEHRRHGLVRGDLACQPPHDLGDLLLQRPDAALPRVGVDDGAHRVSVEAHDALRDAVCLHLFGDQVAHGDLDLLLQDVAADLDQLHAVE